MPKYQIQLMDGIMDFSGAEIIYKENEMNDAIAPRLPYTIKQVSEAENPKNFIKFMQGNFPNPETLETMLYYLSLIPARETDFRYCGVFHGGFASGKTATIEVMREVLPGFIENIPGEYIFRRSLSQLCFFDIEGKGAGVITEVSHDIPIFKPLVKLLTGGDTITTRTLYQVPKTYVPTAQIIICTNKVIDFGEGDEGIEARLIVIPFSQKHERGNRETKTFSEIITSIYNEFPGVLRYLINGYYIPLRDTRRGEIPQSEECLKYKKWFHRMVAPGTALGGLKECAECHSCVTHTDANGRCPYCGDSLE